MRTLVLATWVFINIVFFGVCIYMYLLWSYYWMNDGKDIQSTTLNYDQEIYYYNHGYPQSYYNDSNRKNYNLTEKKSRMKHSSRDNNTVIVIKNSQPRFLSLQTNFQMDTNKYVCLKTDNTSTCREKTLAYRKNILAELNKVLVEEGNVLKETSNPYNVTFQGARVPYLENIPQTVLKKLLSLKIHTIKKKDMESIDNHFKNYLPRKELFDNRYFKSCAVVASSGALKGSNLGRIIDSYNVVLRFNNAPTKGYESDVGRKTTMRIVNSQVVSKDTFLESKLFENVTLVVWDPSNYTSSLEDWYHHPEHEFFTNYRKYKTKFLKSRFFIVNPKSLWDLWTFLQSAMIYRIRKNPPSSGFLGISILLPHCDYVDVFEYIPSVRVSRKCHYYDKSDNPACTFGVWHPLAAEKLLSYFLNIANDTTVFQTGFIRIPGYQVP